MNFSLTNVGAKIVKVTSIELCAITFLEYRVVYLTSFKSFIYYNGSRISFYD